MRAPNGSLTRVAVARAALAAAALSAAVGCLDDRTLPADPAAAVPNAPLNLALDARLVAAAPALDVRVYYLRTDGTTGDLLRRRLTLVSGTQQATLVVDPGPCLADARRLSATTATACVVGASLTTLDAAGAPADSTVVLPVEVAAGDTRVIGGEVAVGQSQWKQVAVGGFASCGLWRDGSVWCWGNGEVGQVGVLANQRAPVRVAAAARFAKVSAGLGAACALTALGQAWCWGLDQFGGLGRGGVSSSRCGSPTVAARAEVTGPLACAPAPAPVVGGLTFRDISVGAVHTCALTAAGRPYCWGLDSFIGVGNADPNVRTPVPQPTAVVGGRAFESISAGALHTCALTAAGQAYCWGTNDFGELGTASFSGTDAFSPVPVPVSGGLTFRAISAGEQYTCGVTTSDEAYCWGSDEHLQAGVESRFSDPNKYFAPRRVALTQPIAQIGAGYESTCAVTRAGAGFCWGNNASGQLGLGNIPLGRCTVGNTTFACSPQPAAITGGLTFAHIEVGVDAACGVTPAGAAYCWGSDAFGQLGAARTSTSGPSTTPVAVREPAAG